MFPLYTRNFVPFETNRLDFHLTSGRVPDPIGRMGESLAQLRDRLELLSEAELAAVGLDPRRGARALWTREVRRRERVAAEAERLERMLTHERELWREGLVVAGVDEVGAGPLAGPVMAAAVVLPAHVSFDGINDSKQLDREARETLAVEIRARALAWAVGECTREEIDRMNIYQASHEAMRRAVVGLSVSPDVLLVDARTVPDVPQKQRALIKGDTQSQAIAAASIVAKVTRDAWMRSAAERFPGYGFESHKGYYCPQHLEALAELGPCPLHRRSFSPVAAVCPESELVELEAARLAHQAGA